jgi:glucose/arabinose dehydrogenase
MLRPLALALLVTAAPALAQSRVPVGNFTVEKLADLPKAWGMVQLPDSSWLLTQKSGELRRFAGGKLGAPIAGVPAVVDRGQGGLADVALHPQFARNRTIYLSYAEAGDDGVTGGAVARAVLDGDRLSDVRVIWRQVPKVNGNGHFSGRMTFGPDGKLWVASGERQKLTPAQDRQSNLGKIVRLNDDGSIPADNPFARGGDTRADVFSIGQRNPLGIAFAPDGKLWEVEMGPKGGDEMNLIRARADYGWPSVSWGDHYDGRDIPNHDTRPEFAKPAVVWRNVISPSSLTWYDGSAFPAWRGHFLIGGLSSQSIVRVKTDGDSAREVERIEMGERIRDVAQGRDGAIYFLSDGPNGALKRLTPKRP